MIKLATYAALGVLDVARHRAPDILAPPTRHDTSPIPPLAPLMPKPDVKKPARARSTRKKHVCRWDTADIWGAFLFGLMLGGFVIYAIL